MALFVKLPCEFTSCCSWVVRRSLSMIICITEHQQSFPEHHKSWVTKLMSCANKLRHLWKYDLANALYFYFIPSEKQPPSQCWNADIKILYCHESSPKIFVCHLKFQKKKIIVSCKTHPVWLFYTNEINRICWEYVKCLTTM